MDNALLNFYHKYFWGMKRGTTVFTVVENVFECDRTIFCDVVKLIIDT